jgi:hypothetical protein
VFFGLKRDMGSTDGPCKESVGILCFTSPILTLVFALRCYATTCLGNPHNEIKPHRYNGKQLRYDTVRFIKVFYSDRMRIISLCAINNE